MHVALRAEVALSWECCDRATVMNCRLLAIARFRWTRSARASVAAGCRSTFCLLVCQLGAGNSGTESGGVRRRRTALAMRWLISYSRERNEKSMAEKLAAEVLAASKGEGNAVKKKEDTHRMAEANKAFAHYRW